MKKEDTTFASVAIIDYASAMTGFIAKKAAYNSAKDQTSYIRAFCAQNKDAITTAFFAPKALEKMIAYCEAATASAYRELKDAARIFLATVERLGDATDIRAHANFVEQAQYVVRHKA